MDNRKLCMLLATLIMPLATYAETLGEQSETADTSFCVNGKKIVVSDRNRQTTVSVFSKDGEELNKLKEMEFTDGQEIERVYISSPFLPYKYNKAHSRHRAPFVNHIPTFYVGMSVLSGKALGFGADKDLHTKDSRSFEVGLSAFQLALPFNAQRTIGLSFAMQSGFMHHHFDTRHALFNDNGIVSIKPVETEGMKKSYISYIYARFPFLVEFQSHRSRTVFFGTGLSLELRGKEHSRYKCADGTITPTKDINLNAVGLNFEMMMGYSCFTLFMRSALTPLLNKSNSPECHPTNIGVGFSF